MGYDVFISYNNKDRTFADNLVSSLAKRNIRCWIDHYDLPPGSSWGDEIFNAITENYGLLMVVILSGKTLQSKQVTREVGLADNNDIYIVPVRIEDVELKGALALYLNGKHRIDAFDIGIDMTAEQICTVVKERVINPPEPPITTTQYQPLREFLEKTPIHIKELTLSFERIEQIIERSLPKSSYKHTAWWSNGTATAHSHAKAWLDAGWKRSRLNLVEKYVIFTRVPLSL
ncbi:MAG: toll/interleukin-1 receptor domain-containing protein [Nitrospirae bacterium]|nr:toll/interleukin-1 receptor domain-containing protein [Nitrospirota bacterium]MBF0590880.1 toll/interleukin-1 receptor domain-containing protein [Nitrospirota bacterium]